MKVKRANKQEIHNRVAHAANLVAEGQAYNAVIKGLNELINCIFLLLRICHISSFSIFAHCKQ